MREPCLAQEAAGLLVAFAVHQHAARQDAERSLHDAHVLVDESMRDARLIEQGIGEGDQDGVVAAEKLNHRARVAQFAGGREAGAEAKPWLCHRVAFCAALPRFMLPWTRSVPVGVVLSFDETQAERASIAPLVNVTAPGMERVNRVIIERTGSDVTLIPEVARYLIDSGGKRLRPMVTVASAKACGYRGDADIKLAACVEFMHTATLFHDDVVDESDTRRGKRSARLVWGNQESVLVGDFLLGQAFKMMVEVGSLEALEVLSNAAATIAEGEVMQLTTAKNTETTEDEYLDVIRAKTAVLFSAAAEVGAIVAKAERGVRAAFRSYGSNLGIAFQLIDDALDYGGQAPTLGKDIGDDFREGKVTLPVVLAYRRGTSEDRAFWTRTLVGGEIGEADLGHAIALLDRTRALKDTVERARHYGAMARDALAPLPEEPCKEALLEAVAFCIARAH